MYNYVSQAWVNSLKEFMAPEGFIEITCHIPSVGKSLIFYKDDIIRFSHKQSGSLLSAELPKNYIEFSLNNSDGRWNPSNPEGLYKYLSDRLLIYVRYGFDINGVIEWIPGGAFLLSEWSTKQNGYEASFVARDILECMIDVSCEQVPVGSIANAIDSAVSLVELPPFGEVIYADGMNDYSIVDDESRSSLTVAEVIQKSANATRSIIYQRRGWFHLYVQPHDNSDTEYTIPLKLSYAYPEIEFSRQLKAIEVKYAGDKKATLNVGTTGEVQTLDNDFISTEDQAFEVAEWVSKNLRSRKKISGEWRGDPRLDVFDVVWVETKYGVREKVILTDVNLSFTGAFKMTYTGYIDTSAYTVDHYSGEIYTGEVL